MSPKKIQLSENKNVYIKWDDGSENVISVKTLRENCPCATCYAEKEKQGKSYIPIYTESELSIDNIRIVGHYALGITWKDGHNTGIYEFQKLLQMANK
ncbi:MAG: DUF971 domain-containing protein [Melioribacteraceae bacterium]|nr:DUF971 domain-containing protein [Melioribacteraceae bacterium]MCF8352803.1 DUF971 domain-containing protein [Melioribacteraceae bacterium]MCF8393477.1 DUF971 domain-containing protein [Melioribacteraceae bacterium]MCF8417320.1 DUF971 domain-containing protein [Melioribacteraceae bacterium]